MKVWFEVKNGRFVNANIACAYQGLVEIEKYPFDTFIEEDIPLLAKKLDLRENLIVGKIESVRAFFRLQNLPEPRISTYPISLRKYLKRRIGLVEKSYFCENFEHFRGIFIKPFKQKKFSGFVFWLMSDLLKLNKLESDDLLWYSEYVEILSEWRVFVSEKKIRAIISYGGNPTIFPNIDLVREMISEYQEAPVAYGLDVGFTSSGNTILVEVNDAFALGSYGINPRIQAQMLEARWEELTKGID